MTTKTMPYARNDAFAGDHQADDTGRFKVFYVSRPDARLLMAAAGKVRNPGHPDYIPCGWRWQALPDAPKLHGPFSSSSAAYKDAIKTFAQDTTA